MVLLLLSFPYPFQLLPQLMDFPFERLFVPLLQLTRTQKFLKNAM